jgi:hypothetical protein
VPAHLHVGAALDHFLEVILWDVGEALGGVRLPLGQASFLGR